jgi:hypothetical protein
MPDRPENRLLDLLARERAALLAGDLSALLALIAEKERLTALLANAPAPSGEGLARLAEAARSNQALIESALKGVKAVRERFAALKNGGPALSTYDARGKATEHGAPCAALERRA